MKLKMMKAISVLAIAALVLASVGTAVGSEEPAKSESVQNKTIIKTQENASEQTDEENGLLSVLAEKAVQDNSEAQGSKQTETVISENIDKESEETAETKTDVAAVSLQQEEANSEEAEVNGEADESEDEEENLVAVKTWNISANKNSNVTMTIYANELNSQAESGTTVEIYEDAKKVVISGEGEMEDDIYTNFISLEKYIDTSVQLVGDYYGVEVQAVYDENLTDVMEIDETIELYALTSSEDGKIEAGDELMMTDEIRASLNPVDMLEFSPEEVVIESGVTNVSDYAFMFCADLKEITLPDTIEKIGTCAFAYCSGLTEITIPASVTVMYDSAFAFCTNLTTINIANYSNAAKFDFRNTNANVICSYSFDEEDEISCRFLYD